MTRRQRFLGRVVQRESLVTLVEAASTQTPGVALVYGDGGAGKTRLLDEVLAALPAGTLIGRGAGVGFLGGRLPYAPLVAAVRSLLSRLPPAEVTELVGADPGTLALLLPELGARKEDASDQTRLIAAVCSLFDRAALRHPTVLVLDDLHCADVATLEVLAYLCAALDRQRLAVVVAFRPDEADEVLADWLQEVRRGPHVLDVAVPGMSLVETRAQLTDLLGGDPGSVLGESLFARIHTRSGGNPYVAEALMRAALDGDEDTLPASLREALVRRTRACTPLAAEVLRTVAAAGDRVPPTLLREVIASGAPGSVSEADLDLAMDEAVRAQLLVVEPDGRVSLRHALLAEALYADLLPGERRRLHGRLLAALAPQAERSAPAVDVRPGVLAEHADRAGDAALALVWSLRAARSAEGVHAYDEAHRQYVRVRRLWPSVPDAGSLAGGDVVDVFSQAAAVAAICDHDAEAVEIIEGVRSWLQADPEVDPVRLGLLEVRYARFLLDRGRIDAALVAARRAVGLVPADPPSPARSVVVSGLVHVLDWAGGSPDWEPLADEAVAVARALDDGPELARALVVRTTVRPTGPGVLDDCREAVALALAEGDPELVGQTYSNLVDALQCLGQARDGVDAASAGVAAVTRRGLGIRYGSWLSTQAAELAVTAGWWEEADRFLVDALAHTRSVPGSNRDYALLTRARLSALRGDWDGVAADLADVGRLPAVLELVHSECRAESLLWQGDADGALAMVAEHAASATGRLLTMSSSLAWLGARSLADAGESRRRTGSAGPGGPGWAETAAVVDDLVQDACGPQALPGWVPGAFRLLCAAERSRSLEDPGPDPWRAAVEAFTAVERPYLLAYARWRLGQALVAARDLAGAAECLRLAAAEAGRLGATPLLGQVESLARRTRIDLRPPQRLRATTGGPGATLTAREREILGHLAAGRTNGEIAKALVISTKTASVHVSNILRKLGVSTRYEAAELADRLAGVPD